MFKFNNGETTQYLRFERFENSAGTLLHVFLDEAGAEIKVDYMQFTQMVKNGTLGLLK